MAPQPGAPGQADLEAILEIVYIYFSGDREKVDHWLRTPNGMLHNKAPMDFIRGGEPEKLLEVIRDMVESTEAGQ